MLCSQSPAPLLTMGPRFIGGPNGWDRVGRTATQMSSPPEPPSLLEQKYSSSPSAEIAGKPSQHTALPRERGIAVRKDTDVLARVLTKV